MLRDDFRRLTWSSEVKFATRLALAQPLFINNDGTQSDDVTVEDQSEHSTRKNMSLVFYIGMSLSVIKKLYKLYLLL